LVNEPNGDSATAIYCLEAELNHGVNAARGFVSVINAQKSITIYGEPLLA